MCCVLALQLVNIFAGNEHASLTSDESQEDENVNHSSLYGAAKGMLFKDNLQAFSLYCWL